MLRGKNWAYLVLGASGGILGINPPLVYGSRENKGGGFKATDDWNPLSISRSCENKGGFKRSGAGDDMVFFFHQKKTRSGEMIEHEPAKTTLLLWKF